MKKEGKNSESERYGFSVRKNGKGFGIYATASYRKDDFICTFTGKKGGAGSLWHNIGDFRSEINNTFQISSKLYIELDEPFIYFNHSCDPNAIFRGKTRLYAFRNIKRGEEITYDYSTTIDESFVCRCGTKKCRGSVADFFVLPKNVQGFYFNKNALPSFIRKKYAAQAKKRMGP